MASIEENINRRALIYGIGLLGLLLIMSINQIWWLYRVPLSFLIPILGAWIWCNFLHKYIFKSFTYKELGLLNFFLLIAIWVGTSAVTVLLDVFGYRIKITDYLSYQTLSLINVCIIYIIYLEIRVALLRKGKS